MQINVSGLQTLGLFAVLQLLLVFVVYTTGFICNGVFGIQNWSDFSRYMLSLMYVFGSSGIVIFILEGL